MNERKGYLKGLRVRRAATHITENSPQAITGALQGKRGQAPVENQRTHRRVCPKRTSRGSCGSRPQQNGRDGSAFGEGIEGEEGAAHAGAFFAPAGEDGEDERGAALGELGYSFGGGAPDGGALVGGEGLQD